MEHSPVKIIIADHQFLIAESLKLILSNDKRYAVAGSVHSRDQLISTLQNEQHGVLITDTNLFDYNGPEDLTYIRQRFPDFAILILTNSLSKAEFQELSKTGVKNILYKTTERDELFIAIDAALKGKKYYSDEILDLILDESESKTLSDEPTHLTSSEMEIVRLIASGLTTKDIANKKHIK